MKALAERAAALLGGQAVRSRALPGGSLSEIVGIDLADGRTAIVKSGPSPRTEAAMLRAIRDSGTRAPEILAVDDDTLVLEAIPADGRLADAWADLGSQIAKLHAAAASEHYGWDADYAFGTVRIENGWSDDWPSFWGERRLLACVPHVAADLGKRIEALARDLPNRLPSQPRPALLHGDLWGGNVLVSGGRISGLIDPACYYGDADVDLAMLGLFDHPTADFQSAYGAPEAGQVDRRPIYALWPALVHLRLFGSGYRSIVEACLSAARA